jgi:hypothetical protein
MTIYETLTILRKLKQNNTKLNEVHEFLVNSENVTVIRRYYFL